MNEDSYLPDARDSFDKGWAYYEAAHRASRDGEDRYVAAIGATVLADDTRRQRRSLMLASAVTLGICVFGLVPKSIPAMDLDLSGAKTLVVLIGTGSFTLYFWLEFTIYAARDYRRWRRVVRIAFREMTNAFAYEVGQIAETFSQSLHVVEQKQREVRAIQDEYGEDPYAPGDTAWGPYVGFGPGAWAEYRLPHIIALLAVASWSIGLVCFPWAALAAGI